MHKVKFGQNNFTPFENNIHNITIPTITQFNKSKDLELLDSNLYNRVQSFVNVENILILSIAIVISSIVTLSVLIIYSRVKKCLSTKNNYNTNFKSKLRKFPTRLETKENSELYLNDLKECI